MSLAERYRDALFRLLPRGPAWPRVPNTDLFRLLSALAVELSRVDERARAMLDEKDPRTTSELVSEWERLLELPGQCLDLATNLADRRRDITQKITAVGGQSKAYYEELAATVGFDVEIKDYRDIPGGVAAASHLTAGEQLHTWVVTYALDAFPTFRVGENTVGDRLREFGQERVQCFFEQIKPAHTYVVYTYIEGT